MSVKKATILKLIDDTAKSANELKGDFAWQAIGMSGGDPELKAELELKAHVYNAKEETCKTIYRIVVENL